MPLSPPWGGLRLRDGCDRLRLWGLCLGEQDQPGNRFGRCRSCWGRGPRPGRCCGGWGWGLRLRRSRCRRGSGVRDRKALGGRLFPTRSRRAVRAARSPQRLSSHSFIRQSSASVRETAAAVEAVWVCPSTSSRYISRWPLANSPRAVRVFSSYSPVSRAAPPGERCDESADPGPDPKALAKGPQYPYRPGRAGQNAAAHPGCCAGE